MGDRSYDRNESEPKWSRGKLSGQALFGKKLRKYGKKKICFPFWEFCNIPETDVMFWSCCFWCLIFFGIVKRQRMYDTHVKTWVVVWLKTVRQWKKQSSTGQKTKQETSELIVDRPNAFFLVTVTQLIFDGWGFKGSCPPQMLSFSVRWQQPQGFPRKLPAGWVFVCGAGVLEGSAPQDAILAVKNYQLNGTESSMCILALFKSPRELSFYL